jgi:hypothetical protein
MIRILNSIRHSLLARILAACILLVCGAADMWGATYTWTGGGGADTSWTNVNNWGGSGYPGQSGNAGNDVAEFGTSPAASTVTIDTAVAISGLNIYNGSSGLLTCNLNGNSISVSSGNFNLGNSGSGVAGHLVMNGSGTVSTQNFDSSQNADCSLSLNTTVDFTVIEKIFADGASEYTTTISGDSSCGFTIPGSYESAGSNVIVFEGDMIVSSVSGDYSMTYAPSPSPVATVTVTVSNSTTSFTTLKYDITVKDVTAATNELYTVNGTSYTATATDQLMSFPAAQTQTFDVVFPSAMDPSDGISLVVKNSGTTAIGTLMYYAPSSTTTSIWTGTGTVDWTSGTNWDTVPGAATKYIIINSGTATAGADIPAGTLTSLEKITISSGAVLACNGKDFGSVAMVNNGTVQLSGSETNIGTTTNGTDSTVEYTSGGNTSLWGSGSFYNLTIDSGTFICGSAVSVIGTLVNNGIVTAGAENLSFSKYSGTGSVNASSGTVSLTGTTTGTIDALEFTGDGTAANSGSSLLTVTSLTLAAASSVQVSASGSGSITIGSASYNSADITTVGTVSLPAGSVGTITVTSGSLSLPGNMTVNGNIANNGVLSAADTVTLSPSSVCTITGTAAAADTTFSALSCSGQGGRTLSVDGYITVSGTLSLSGTSSASLLAVAGTGTIDLTSGDTTAAFLSIGSGPEITTAVITAGNSVSSTGTLPSGWKFVLYTWAGNTDTSWTDKTNWDTGEVPGSTDSVLIPDTSLGSNVYPVIGTAVSVQNMTVEAPASVTLSSASAVTVSGTLSNSGAIIYQSSGRITSNGTTAINDTTHTGTVEYSAGSGTITNFSAGTDYYNLTVSGGTWTSTAALAAVGDLTVTGAGTSAVFGGSLSVSGNLSTADTAAVSFNNTPGAAETTTITGTVTFGSTGAVSFGNDSGDAFTVHTGGINVSAVTGTITIAGTMAVAAGSPITISTDVTLAADTVFASPVALAGSGAIGFTNAAAAAKTVSFDNTVTGNTTGTVSFGAAGYPVNGVFGDGSGSDSVSAMALLTVSGTTTVKSSASIAADVTAQIYNGNVTNNGVIHCGTGGVELNGSYNGTSGTLNNNAAGGTAFTFSGTSDYTVSVGTYAANGGTLTFNGTGTGAVSFTPGSSTYGDITVNKTGSGAKLDFGTNNFKQSSTAVFKIDNGNVTIETGTFECGILTINGGTFTQTGANTGIVAGDSGFQYAAGLVNNVSSASALVWDSGSAGGYLTVGGNVSGTYSSSIVFNKKNVTIGTDSTISGTFYDLTIPAGVTVTNGTGITVLHDFTIKNTGTYSKNGQVLTLGGAGEAGTVTDSNGTLQDLGTVTINDTGSVTLSAGSALLSASLDISSGTFASKGYAVTVTGSVVGPSGTWNAVNGTGTDGTITVGGNFSVGTYTASSADTKLAGDITLTTFSANGGTLILNGAAQAFSTNDQILNNLTLSGAGSKTVTGILDVNGNFGGTAGTLTAGAQVNFGGNADFSSLGFTAGTGTVSFDGGSDQILTINTSTGTTFSKLNVTTTGGTFIVADDTTQILTADLITVNTTQDVTFGSAVQTSGSTKKIAITDAGTLLFKQPVAADTLELTQTGGTTFYETVSAGVLSDAATAGNITFNSNVSVSTLTDGAFYTAGTVTLGNDSADSCIFTGGISHTDTVTMRTTVLGGSLTTSDAPVTFDNLILDADASVTTKSLSGSGAGIIVNGTVTNSTSHALSLTAGTGNIQLTGAVGTPSVRLGAVTIVSSYNVAGDDSALSVPAVAAGALYAASLTQNAGSGTTRLSSADLTGDMNLTVTGTGIAADSTITASSVVLAGGSVDLNGTVTAPSGFLSTGTTFDNTGAAITTTGTALTINHTGAVMVGADLSSGAGTAGAVTVTSSGGTVTVSGAVTSGAGMITVTGTGSSNAVHILGALNSTTGTIDIDSASTLDISNTVTATTGNVTIDSSGISSLNSAADITTTTGTVTFGASKGGTLSTAGAVTTEGVAADGTGTVIFTNGVNLTGPVVIDSTDGGTSAGGRVTFSSTLDSDSAVTERALTIDAGSGAVTCTGAAGSTAPLASFTLTHSGTLTFNSALTVSGALTQVNAATGATLFGGSTATAAATSVGSADLNGTSYTVNGKITVTSGSLSVTNSGLFLSAENADIDLTSGSFIQDGSGLNQLAGGITTHGTGAVTFATDVYLYGSDTDGMTLGGGGAVTVGASGTKDLHIAASTASKIIAIASPLTAENIVLYGGALSLGADITANADLVLLNGNTDTMYKDSATGLTTLYAYNTAASPSRSGTASPSLSSFPAEYPDGTAFIDGSSTSYCGAVSGLAGRTLTAGQNFYDNGVNLEGTASWTLKLKDNSTATNAFAEAYNMMVSYGHVTTSGTSAWVAAAEDSHDDVSHTTTALNTVNCGWAFSRPLILVNNAGSARDMSGTANLSGTYTVYDDVIRVEFGDSLSLGTPLKIENSRNEIYKAVSRIQYYSGGSLVSFTGTYTDADCTTSTGTAADGSDSAGDTSVFYIKASSTWNTDATGFSAGQEDTPGGGIHYDASTDRSGTHRDSIPCLNLPKALSSVYATLRDCHKNRIGNYDGLPSSNNYDLDGDSVNDSNTAASSGRFTAVADRASPVLIAAYTGQETHTAYSGTAASQPYYDAHNFIEFVYSEAVNIGDLTASGGAENARAETSFASGSEHGGSVETAGSGLLVTGIAGISSGTLKAGSRTTGSIDTTVSSLYRTFPLTAGGMAAAHTARLRVSIAGYVDSTVSVNGSSYRNWIGYIDDAETPSGIVTSLGNNFITDTAGNALADYAAASATSNHHLNVLTISNAETELYGAWDTLAPVFAPFRSVAAESDHPWSLYAQAPESSEAIGNTATGSTNSMLDRIEFHLFDNAPSFSTSDDYVWFSRRGWCSYDTSSSLYTSYSYASDLFGGSRPFDSTAAARTSGGIRYSSVCNSMQAFKYAVGTDATPVSSFDTGKAITGGAKGTVFSTTTDTYNATGTVDSLYFAVYLSDTTLARRSKFTVSYDADVGFITDLAGNRLKSDQINTLDLTPPEFNMTISPVGNNFLYVVFSKKLNLTENGLLWIDDSKIRSYRDPLTFIPKYLELVDTSTSAPSTGIAIDESTPAVKVFSNADYTGLILKLKNSTKTSSDGNVQLTDIENVYLRVKMMGTSTDPITGISGTYISCIQDTAGNSMTLYNAHALSDYAVNVVNPQYAYNTDENSHISDVITSFHSDGSWSVHDWNADQGNYGTLMAGENILIHAGLADGTDDGSGGLPANVTAYFDPNPQSDALSVTYNSNTSQNWRIWLPEVPGVTGDVFEALAPINNPLSGTGFITTAGAAGQGDNTYMNFTLASTDLSSKGWKAGDQVKFLFGIMDSSATPQPVMIRHVPVYNGDSTGGTYSGTEYPLFALRLTQSLNNSDTLESAGKKIASSLDLWSFKLKSLVSQRGGVTILNNVINASAGETAVVKVTMPSDGKLSIVVMTLDGDIVQYLQHGTTTSGEHFYKWNGTTKSGRRVARGMYFIRVFGTGIDETRKVMVVKD